jgi:hypothetical protein
MPFPDRWDILEEILEARRFARRLETPDFDPETILLECFDKQCGFIRSTSRRKVAVTGRRAGKTVSDRYHLVYTAAANPGCYCGYGAKTRSFAKDLIWRDLVQLVRRFFPSAKINETELKIILPSGSVIKVFGAKDFDEADKARGFPFLLVLLDEVEAFRSEVLEYLLNEVLAASLADHHGTIAVTGTPDGSCMGYLYDIDQGEWADSWEHHHWTMADNARFPQWAGKENWREIADRFIASELAELRLDPSDPWVQREYFGKWVRSLDAFILHIDDTQNVYDGPAPPGLEHVLGIDLGFSDESAFSVQGFSRTTGRVYHVAEVSHPGMGMGEIVAVARGLIEQYRPIRTVIDPATGGANLVEELRRRYGVGVQYAEKDNKAAYFRLWNADIRSYRYLFLRGSRALAQARAVQWDDAYKKEREGIPCDLVDASLYAWRECYHYLPKREIVVQRILDPSRDDSELDFLPPTKSRSVKSVRRG